jgi:hypothetical protein
MTDGGLGFTERNLRRAILKRSGSPIAFCHLKRSFNLAPLFFVGFSSLYRLV